jgi:TIR domain
MKRCYAATKQRAPGAGIAAGCRSGEGGKAVAIIRVGLHHRHVAVGRIEKTVFVSYRRTDESWALAIFQDLTQHGYDVFIDYDGIASGNFETAILENIRARAHFLVLLTPTALDRCGDTKDWMRREIEAALDSQRNIVPLMLAGFDFGKPAIADQLTGKLAELKKYNGLEIPKAKFFSSEMGRLRNKFLNVQVDAVLHPASDSAQQAATEQKDKAATMARGEALGKLKQEETAAQQRAEGKRLRKKIQTKRQTVVETQRAKEDRRSRVMEEQRRSVQEQELTKAKSADSAVSEIGEWTAKITNTSWPDFIIELYRGDEHHFIQWGSISWHALGTKLDGMEVDRWRAAFHRETKLKIAATTFHLIVSVSVFKRKTQVELWSGELWSSDRQLILKSELLYSESLSLHRASPKGD